MEFTKNQWGLIQRYHDNLALNKRISFEVGKLEEEFDIELPELYQKHN